MAPAIVFGLVVILAIGSECQAQAQPMEAGDRGFSVQGPPSPYSCEEKPKYVNDTCEAQADCNSYMMECRNGFCLCRHIYIEEPAQEDKDRRVCRSAPTLERSCTDECEKPLTCTSIAQGKICACLPPAKMDNGACILECKADEIFLGGECKKRCTSDEIRIDNAGCVKRSPVGGKCVDNVQCGIAFSECVEGSCKCKSGFAVKDGKCESKNYVCPSGDPIMANGAVKRCKLVKEPFQTVFIPSPVPYRRHDLEDDCGENEFCMADGNGRSEEGAAGHCCPVEKTRCPVGEAHPNASCDQHTVGCPYSTHYCYNKDQYSPSACCPSPCNGDAVFVDGKCLPRAQYGDTCSSDVQCKGHEGQCIDGICKCGGNSTALGNARYKYCSIQCDLDQIEYGNRCYPRLKLGESCQPGTNQCPANAYCNSKNVCACRCDYHPVGDSICGPPPVCKASPARTLISFSPRSGSSAAPEVPKNSNFTFCKVGPGSNAPVPEALDQCPAGETCTYYIGNLGLCCPTPKPKCPNGETSNQKCDSKNPCGKGNFCYRYFTPANATDTSLGYICCAGSPMPTPIDCREMTC